MKRLTQLLLTALISQFAFGSIIYDTLRNQYTWSYGNCFGGSYWYGQNYDFRVADDVTLDQPVTIHSLSGRYIGLGIFPIIGAKVWIYADDNGRPGKLIAAESGDVTVTTFRVAFPELIFRQPYVGKEVRIEGLNIGLDHGRYWVCLQPISDDWYFQACGPYNRGSSAMEKDFNSLFMWEPIDRPLDTNLRIEGDS